MSIPFNFVHAADLHLGTPFSGLGETSPDAARALRDATLGAFENLVNLCLSRDAAFLVIAGDVYDGPERSIRVLDAFVKGVERLGERSIPVFVATGNHDPLTSRAWSSAGKLPSNLVLFGSKPSSHQVVRDGETIAVVHGVGYRGRHVSEDLAGSIRRTQPGGFEVGVLHATVGGAQGHEVYAPTTVETLKGAGLDYWALGHVHTRAVLSASEPVIVYSGNLQALSSRETGARGAFLVEVDELGRPTPDFVELDRVHFARLRVDVAAVSHEAKLPSALLAEARRAAQDSDGRALVVDFCLTGRTPLYRVLNEPRQLEELLAGLRADLEESTPLVWANRIENATAPLLDIERLAASRTIEADLIRIAGALSDDPVALEAFGREALSPLYGKAGMKKLLGQPPDGEALKEELLAARDLALDLLAGVEQ